MSPHFGLMDASQMSHDEALLLRAKLHYRCGKRRVAEHKISAGLATLYDALLSAMRWYILCHFPEELGRDADEKLENERLVFSLLRKRGVIDEGFDLNRFQDIVDMALMNENVILDPDEVLKEVDDFLNRIAMLPFDESELPPEDPNTF